MDETDEMDELLEETEETDELEELTEETEETDELLDEVDETEELDGLSDDGEDSEEGKNTEEHDDMELLEYITQAGIDQCLNLKQLVKRS